MHDNELLLKTNIQADIQTQWKIFLVLLLMMLLVMAGLIIRCRMLRKSIVHPNSKKEKSRTQILRRWEAGIGFGLFAIVLLSTVHGILLAPKYRDLRTGAAEQLAITEAGTVQTLRNESQMFFNAAIRAEQDGEELELKIPFGETAEHICSLLPGVIVYGKNSRLIVQVISEDTYGEDP